MSAMDVDSSEELLPSSSSSIKYVDFDQISNTILYITRGVTLNQPRLLQRAIRQNTSIRKYITVTQLSNLVKKYIPTDWPNVTVMNELMDKVGKSPLLLKELEVKK